METITSVKNEIVYKTIKIKENKERGKLFLESIKLIQEARISGHQIEYVLIEQNKEDYFRKYFSFIFDYKYYIVCSSVFEKVCDTVSPQGIACVVKFIEKEIKQIQNNFLILENLQDPGNLGTIIRSASGTTFKDIFLINCVDFCNQKVVRSSMGGIFKENLYTFNSLDDFLEYAKREQLNLLVATMEGENIFKYNLPSNKLGLVVGNEGNGVSAKLKQFAKHLVSIPMKNGLESLNAGVSCSILMYYLDNK